MTIAVRGRKWSSLLVVSAVAGLGSSTPAEANSREIAGTIVSVSGKVLVRNTMDDAPKMTLAKAGDKIAAGSVINTDSAGSVKLMLTDKSIIDLGASTLFRVDEYSLKNGPDRKVGLSMEYGKIRASVTAKVSPMGKYGVRAKSVTMGVRGTEFVVMSDLANFVQAGGTTETGAKAPAGGSGGGTAITVVHGKVEVKDEKAPASKPVEATAGTQVKVTDKSDDEGRTPATEKAEAPKVVKLSQEEVAQVKAEAKQADKTFVHAVVMDDSSSGGGKETLASISADFDLGSDFMPSMGEMGTPGTFGSSMGSNMNYNNSLNGMPVNVRVVFVK